MTEIETLLHKGADADTVDQNGFSLLMNYAKKGDLESVKALVRYGASVNKKDMNSLSAIDYAIVSEALPVIEFLVENGAFVSPDNYMLAVNKNRKTIVEYFDSLDPNKHVFLKKRNI
ncbi:MAG: ankyrin repeat domain-containing protein [Campylobacterota bacterium]|nr:ankyrin repeat domain-containing protein [Campylobacterota bacterium]